MKRFLLLLACCLSMSVSAEMFEIPGTNISIDKPDNFHLAETGSYLVDDTGEMVITISTMAVPENIPNKTMTELFHDIESFDNQSFKGEIGHRVRHKHGGGYDAFMLVAHGKHMAKLFHVSVTAGNNGEYSENRMELLKSMLLSLRFNDNEISPTKAAGVIFRVDGFHQLTENMNNITLIDSQKNAILVMPQPVWYLSESDFFDRCESGANLMGLKSRNYPKQNKNDFSYCEIDSGSLYQVLVALPKSTLQIGFSSKAKDTYEDNKRKVRQAIKDMTLLRK